MKPFSAFDQSGFGSRQVGSGSPLVYLGDLIGTARVASDSSAFDCAATLLTVFSGRLPDVI